MRTVRRFALIFILLGSCLACGKYGKPLPPEEFAPAEVKSLVVTPSVQGVAFNWSAPDKDARGKKLKELEGYRIYRRELEQNARLSDPQAKFDLIGTIEDTHLKELLDLQEKAREQGQISRRITLPAERSNFQFMDRNVSPGRQYFYQVVAINQNGVEGKVVERIRLHFKGEISEVVRIPHSAEEVQF